MESDLGTSLASPNGRVHFLGRFCQTMTLELCSAAADPASPSLKRRLRAFPARTHRWSWIPSRAAESAEQFDRNAGVRTAHPRVFGAVVEWRAGETGMSHRSSRGRSPAAGEPVRVERKRSKEEIAAGLRVSVSSGGDS
jgi:hypothetical protein